MSPNMDTDGLNNEWMIRPIRMEEVVEARRLIYGVAHELMEPQMSMEEVTALWDSWNVFNDLDDIQKSYFEDTGVFLVTVASGQIIGTGAFHRYTEGMCELRRIAPLPQYQGQRLGFAMMMELMRRARAMGYRKMVLWTNRVKLTRAVDFYHQLGFVDMHHEGLDEEELWMEMKLTPPVLDHSATPNGGGI